MRLLSLTTLALWTVSTAWDEFHFEGHKHSKHGTMWNYTIRSKEPNLHDPKGRFRMWIVGAVAVELAAIGHTLGCMRLRQAAQQAQLDVIEVWRARRKELEEEQALARISEDMDRGKEKIQSAAEKVATAKEYKAELDALLPATKEQHKTLKGGPTAKGSTEGEQKAGKRVKEGAKVFDQGSASSFRDGSGRTQTLKGQDSGLSPAPSVAASPLLPHRGTSAAEKQTRFEWCIPCGGHAHGASRAVSLESFDDILTRKVSEGHMQNNLDLEGLAVSHQVSEPVPHLRSGIATQPRSFAWPSMLGYAVAHSTSAGLSRQSPRGGPDEHNGGTQATNRWLEALMEGLQRSGDAWTAYFMETSIVQVILRVFARMNHVSGSFLAALGHPVVKVLLRDDRFWQAMILRGISTALWWTAHVFAPEMVVAPLFFTFSILATIMLGPWMLHELYHTREVGANIACVFVVAAAIALDPEATSPPNSKRIVQEMKSMSGDQFERFLLWALGLFVVSLGSMVLLFNAARGQRRAEKFLEELLADLTELCAVPDHPKGMTALQEAVNVTAMRTDSNLTCSQVQDLVMEHRYDLRIVATALDIEKMVKAKAGSIFKVDEAPRRFNWNLASLPILSGLIGGAAYGLHSAGVPWLIKVNSIPQPLRAWVFLVTLVLGIGSAVSATLGACVFDCRFYVPAYSSVWFLSATMLRISLVKRGIISSWPLVANCILLYLAFCRISPARRPMQLSRLLQQAHKPADQMKRVEESPEPVEKATLTWHTPLLEFAQVESNEQKKLAGLNDKHTKDLLVPPRRRSRSGTNHIANLWTFVEDWYLSAVKAVPLALLLGHIAFLVAVLRLFRTTARKLLITNLYSMLTLTVTLASLSLFTGVALWKMHLCMYTDFHKLCQDGGQRRRGKRAGGGRFLLLADPYDTPGSSSDEEVGVEEWQNIRHFVLVENVWYASLRKDVGHLLESIARSPMAKDQTEVILDVRFPGKDEESRKAEVEELTRIMDSFRGSIRRCMFTWNATGVLEQCLDSMVGLKDDVPESLRVLVTRTCADTLFHPEYFSALAFNFLASGKHAYTTIWQPPELPLVDFLNVQSRHKFNGQLALFMSQRQLMTLTSTLSVPLPQTTYSIPWVLLRSVDELQQQLAKKPQIKFQIPTVRSTGLFSRAWLCTGGLSSVEPIFLPVIRRALPRPWMETRYDKTKSAAKLLTEWHAGMRLLEVVHGLHGLYVQQMRFAASGLKRYTYWRFKRRCCFSLRTVLPLVSLMCAHQVSAMWSLSSTLLLGGLIYGLCYDQTLLTTWAYLLGVTNSVIIVLLFVFIVIGNNVLLVQSYDEYRVAVARAQRPMEGVRLQEPQDPQVALQQHLEQRLEEQQQQEEQLRQQQQLQELQQLQQLQMDSVEVDRHWSEEKDGRLVEEKKDEAMRRLNFPSHMGWLEDNISRLLEELQNRQSEFANDTPWPPHRSQSGEIRRPWSERWDPTADLVSLEPLQAVYEARWQLRQRFGVELKTEDVVRLRNTLQLSKEMVLEQCAEVAQSLLQDGDLELLKREEDRHSDEPDSDGQGVTEREAVWNSFAAQLQGSSESKSGWSGEIDTPPGWRGDVLGKQMRILKEPMGQKGLALISQRYDVLVLLFDSCKGILHALSWLRSQRQLLEVLEVKNLFKAPTASGWQQVSCRVRARTSNTTTASDSEGDNAAASPVVFKVLLSHKAFSKVREVVTRQEGEVEELLRAACMVNERNRARLNEILDTALEALRVTKPFAEPRATWEHLLGEWSCPTCHENPFTDEFADRRYNGKPECVCKSCGDLLFASRTAKCYKCGIKHPNPAAVAGDLEQYLSIKGFVGQWASASKPNGTNLGWFCPRCFSHSWKRSVPCKTCESRVLATNMRWRCAACETHWRRLARICWEGITGGIQFGILSMISEWCMAWYLVFPECHSIGDMHNESPEEESTDVFEDFSRSKRSQQTVASTRQVRRIRTRLRQVFPH